LKTTSAIVSAVLMGGALAGTAAPALAGTVSGSAGSFRASMHAGTHHPHVGRKWPVSFSATRKGRAAHAAVSYEYMLGGKVVARRSHYRFRGRFKDTFYWPAQAVGYPLTLRAVVKGSGGAQVYLDYAIQVVK
jgi:hypothetical protein